MTTRVVMYVASRVMHLTAVDVALIACVFVSALALAIDFLRASSIVAIGILCHRPVDVVFGVIGSLAIRRPT